MTRTVKVGLDVDEQPYVRGVGRATGATEKLDDALDDVTGSAKDTAAAVGKAKDSTDDLGGAAKDAGRDLGRLRADAERLDRKINDTANSIRDLARQIAATSDEAERAKLGEKLDVERSRQRRQLDLRKLIDVDSGTKVGAELAEKAGVSFAARLGPVIARAPMAGMNPAVLAIGAPIVAGLVTLVTTAVGGAIVGGVGAGGVVGGLVLAAKDPAVQAAGAELGADLSEMLGRASRAFVPETLGAIDEIDRRVLAMEDDLTRAFSGSSKLLDPLVDALLDAGESVLPGIIADIDAAGPVVEVLADGIRNLGESVGEGLADLAPYADEGARALQSLLYILDVGVDSVFRFVEGMSAVYKVAELVGALLTGDIPKFWALVTAQDGAGSSAEDLQPKLEGVRGKLDGVGDKAGVAAVKVETLDEALHRLVDQNVSTEEAQIRLEEAIDRAAEAAKRNGEGIDRNTAKGRENRKALLDIATATQEVYDRTLEQTGSTELAAQAAERGRKKFLETADAMGVERDKAIALADKLFAIPNVTRTVTINGNPTPAIDSAKNAVARINAMKARINIYAEPHGSFGGPAHSGFGYSTGNRWGGVYEHAQVGVLREAHIASPVAPARYAYAEPATGGEAFIPRYGNEDRSLSILSRAAAWYGQQIVPAGMTGGAAMGAPEVRVFIGDQELRGMVRVEVAQHNRDLRRRVGAGAGRM